MTGRSGSEELGRRKEGGENKQGPDNSTGEKGKKREAEGEGGRGSKTPSHAPPPLLPSSTPLQCLLLPVCLLRASGRPTEGPSLSDRVQFWTEDTVGVRGQSEWGALRSEAGLRTGERRAQEFQVADPRSWLWLLDSPTVTEMTDVE